MKFACPHCTQKFEIADECAGQAMDCPSCQKEFTIPALPAAAVLKRAPTPPADPPSRRPRPLTPGRSVPPKPTRSGSGGFGKLLLTLIALAGLGLGAAMVHFKESPQQVWKRLIDGGTTKPAPPPAPESTLAESTSHPPLEPTPAEPAPPPAPAKPALVPTPASEPTVSPEPAPTPAPKEAKAEPEMVMDQQEKPQPAPRVFAPPRRKTSVRAVAFPTPRFRSPGVLLSREDLETLKANLKREPWKSGFEALANEGRSKLSYKMAGPFKEVKRSPNENLWPWRGDMIAVWNLSRMWYFTGDDAYAKKAHDILLAWAKTHKEFGGRESMLDLGDYVVCFVGGADILRGTWPGWTRADTAAVKKYFNDVLMPASNPYGEHQFGAANKGALALASMGLMAIFNEDTAKLRTIVSQVRVLPHIGLRSSNDIGLLGDSLRDQGHAHGHLVSLAVLAEALWKQGIDIYSDYDNRLLAAGEYFARVNSLTPTPFLPFGTTDAYYTADRTNRGWGGGNVALNLIHGAYVVRMGLPAPYTIRRRQSMPVDGGCFMFVKEVDRSKATPMLPPPIPATASITSGFHSTEIGDASPTPTGNASYSNGTWTVQGGGREIWKENDSCHFTYQTLTGNCAIVAKVESVGNTSPSAKAGVMMRTSLDEGSPRAWMALTGGGNLEQNMPNLAVYGGNNYGNKVLAQSLSSYWVKLERMGNIIAGYVSPDGTNWAATDVGRIDDPVPSKIHVGLVVCSAANGKLNTSTFSNVQITGGDGSAPVVTPAAPAALLAAPGDGSVPLRWQPSFGAASYTVKRATSSGGPYTTLASGITDSSYTDTTVTNGTTYYYVVTATNSAGTSADSPKDTATPMAPRWNVSLGGTATATVGNAGSAFDSNSHTMWYAGGCGGVAAIQYDFGPDHTPAITAYTITSPHFKPERDPRDWQFQGSNDGSDWATLDTQSGQTFPTRFYEVEYALPQPATYRYFRLNVTANNGDNDLHIADIILLSTAPLRNAPMPSRPHWKTHEAPDQKSAMAR